MYGMSRLTMTHVRNEQRERADLGLREVQDTRALEHQDETERVEPVDAAGDQPDDECLGHQEGRRQRCGCSPGGLAVRGAVRLEHVGRVAAMVPVAAEVELARGADAWP